MTKQELLHMYVKLDKRIEILEEALEVLEDEPFASMEPDNEEFCADLSARIEKLRNVADKVERDLLAGGPDKKSQPGDGSKKNVIKFSPRPQQ